MTKFFKRENNNKSKQEQLFDAVERNDFEKVNNLLSHHLEEIDINKLYEDNLPISHIIVKKTLLSIAVKKGHLDIARKLLRNGADININDPDVQNVLGLCKNVKFLNSKSEIDDYSPLHFVAECGFAAFLGKMVDGIKDPSSSELIKFEDDLTKQDNDGMTPLHYIIRAIDNDNVELVEEFLNFIDFNSENIKGVINSSNQQGKSLLHFAASLLNNENEQIVELGKELIENLLEAGAKPQISDEEGKTPTDYIANQDPKNFITDNQKSPISGESLIIRQFRRLSSTIANLFSRGKEKDEDRKTQSIKSDDLDEDRKTKFFDAIKSGDLSLVKQIAQEDEIEFNEMDKDGFAPIHLAIQNGHSEIVRFLVKEKDVDINAADDSAFKYRPIRYAIAKGNIDILKILLDHRNPRDGYLVDVNRKDRFGITPLDFALKRGNSLVIDLLESKGAEESKQHIPKANDPEHQEVPADNGAKKSKQRIIDIEDLNYLLTKNGPYEKGSVTNSIFDFLKEKNLTKTYINGSLGNIRDGKGCGLLHIAIEIIRDEDLALAVLDQEVIDVNLQDNEYKYTALHLAANRDYSAVVDKLIEKGARLDLKDKFGDTAFDVAKARNNDDLQSKLEVKEKHTEPVKSNRNLDSSLSERKKDDRLPLRQPTKRVQISDVDEALETPDTSPRDFVAEFIGECSDVVSDIANSTSSFFSSLLCGDSQDHSQTRK